MMFNVKNYNQQHSRVRDEISNWYMQELSRAILLATDALQVHESQPMTQPVK